MSIPILNFFYIFLHFFSGFGRKLSKVAGANVFSFHYHCPNRPHEMPNTTLCHRVSGKIFLTIQMNFSLKIFLFYKFLFITVIIHHHRIDGYAVQIIFHIS